MSQSLLQPSLGNFSITRLNGMYTVGNGAGLAPPGLSRIFLADAMFYYKDAKGKQTRLSTSEIIFGLLHEIGHIFDFNHANIVGHIPDPTTYWSQYFAEHFGSSCKTVGLLGCSGETYLPSSINVPIFGNVPIPSFGIRTGPYAPSSGATPYGAGSSVDDFAESFAVAVLGAQSPSQLPPPGKSVDAARTTYIQTLFTCYKQKHC